VPTVHQTERTRWTASQERTPLLAQTSDSFDEEATPQRLQSADVRLRSGFVYSEWCCSVFTLRNAVWLDLGRQCDVLSSLSGVIILLFYGVLRNIDGVFPLPMQGIAGWMGRIAPFVYATIFFISGLYHISVPFPFESAFYLELDISGIQVGLCYSCLWMLVLISCNSEGNVLQGVRAQPFIDLLATLVVSLLFFTIQRWRLPSKMTHMDLNSPDSADYRKKHIMPDGWQALRSRMVALLCIGWLFQLTLYENAVRDRQGMTPPPFILVQSLATSLFFVAAFFNLTSVAHIINPYTPTSASHTLWHYMALIALVATVWNMDFLLARWQIDGEWEVPQGW